ncbi:zinc ribbon domain-containing protein [Yoonia litorea]|uniref:Zinc-ribbon domain-containing protein n=1 Tax=Yoonia litorea TaxID=1123755 RepID=A0A1I6MWN3_9RHOB|nr:zinc ribbon domain-containing protein [Yoonia litorea]SFS20064.1 hypothetical protein SAMN05444714_2467 [Yoonia litorea]
MNDGEADIVKAKKETSLIPCEACGSDISTDAKTCPQCGHANAWLHPQLRKAIDHIRKLDRDTKVEAVGNTMTLATSVQNGRQAFASLLLVISGVLLAIGLFIPALLGLAIFLMIVGGMLIGFGLNASTRHELRIDMRTANKVVGEADQKFWKDVSNIVREEKLNDPE